MKGVTRPLPARLLLLAAAAALAACLVLAIVIAEHRDGDGDRSAPVRGGGSVSELRVSSR
jgi:hypothetical protein